MRAAAYSIARAPRRRRTVSKPPFLEQPLDTGCGYRLLLDAKRYRNLRNKDANGHRAFWVEVAWRIPGSSKSRAGFHRLLRKSAHGLGLIEHSDDSKLINSSVQATLSQACDSRHD